MTDRTAAEIVADEALVTADEREALSTITTIVEATSVEGITVVSGFVASDCGCSSRSDLFKTIVTGMPDGLLGPAPRRGGYAAAVNRLPGHVHRARPRANERCAKCLDGCRYTHCEAVAWVEREINGYMRRRIVRTL